MLNSTWFHCLDEIHCPLQACHLPKYLNLILYISKRSALRLLFPISFLFGRKNLCNVHPKRIVVYSLTLLVFLSREPPRTATTGRENVVS